MDSMLTRFDEYVQEIVSGSRSFSTKSTKSLTKIVLNSHDALEEVGCLEVTIEDANF